MNGRMKGIKGCMEGRKEGRKEERKKKMMNDAERNEGKKRTVKKGRK